MCALTTFAFLTTALICRRFLVQARVIPNCNRILVRQQRIEDRRRILLHIGQHMRIDVERNRDGRMAEQLRDNLGIHMLPKQQRRARVAHEWRKSWNRTYGFAQDCASDRVDQRFPSPCKRSLAGRSLTLVVGDDKDS